MRKFAFIFVLFLCSSMVFAADANEPIKFGANFRDADANNNVVSTTTRYYAKMLPAGATLTSDGLLEWEPNSTQGGTYRMYYFVEKTVLYFDGHIEVLTSPLATNLIFVEEEPQRPFLVSPPDLFVKENHKLVYQLKIVPEVNDNIFDANFADTK